MSYTPEITETKIAALIKSELRLTHVPVAETFYNLGYTNRDLQRIQQRIAKTFQRTVSSIMYSDTVISITERLTSTHKNHGRINH